MFHDLYVLRNIAKRSVRAILALLINFFFNFGGLLAGYWFTKLFLNSKSREDMVIINDIKAVIVLLAGIYLAVDLFLNLDVIPAEILYAVIAFYFGSRK